MNSDALATSPPMIAASSSFSKLPTAFHSRRLCFAADI
jgi:hypothetical protein